MDMSNLLSRRVTNWIYVKRVLVWCKRIIDRCVKMACIRECLN